MILNSEQTLFMEDLYDRYVKDPLSVPESWATYFRHIDSSNESSSTVGQAPRLDITGGENTKNGLIPKEFGAQSLVESYRRFGILAADLDPLKFAKQNRELLQLEHYGLSKSDLDTEFYTSVPSIGKRKLRGIIEKLEKFYCSSIGIEYAYIRNTSERNWLEQQMESDENHQTLPLRERLHLFERLYQAECFEKFLAQKYVGKKRFSIEGCESFIPLLDTSIDIGASLGVKCCVIGMAHRGRLNVLVNILQKPASVVFAEFDENYNPETLDYGDVKYHLGYSCDRTAVCGEPIHLSLAFNPSHLEAVSPVVLGSVRGRQTRHGDTERKEFLPILVHGDAAFMGQGVVSESLNLCNLSGYTVGGTIHIVINNQIGFTTLPYESRSTEYATDLAKGFQFPILHVNSDDPEACYRAAKIALEYRQKFGKDIIIDLIGYRRLGHNETDEPAFTQPIMYSVIKKHPSTVQVYRKKLEGDSDITVELLDSMESGCRKSLQESFEYSREVNVKMKVDTMKGAWADFSRNTSASDPDTFILGKQLNHVAKAITFPPSDFKVHPKLLRLLETRHQMFVGKLPIDWGFAEALAFGSILENGCGIRLSGQDCKRGTFSHRHCVLTDIENEREYTPLNHISKKQGLIEVCNSPLSEFSVLGFDYGYSLANPQDLVLWEAQFGDFANGAQIIFDQFISSSEVKWYRMSGLVVLLPHGFEGQGPEHSSGRLERFLQLCANNNMQVCNCSNPAQYFHLLRRQVLRKFRKPLIIMTPKSLLRLAQAGSSLQDIMTGSFQEVIVDRDFCDLRQAEHVVFCSGKIYYNLHASQKEQKKKTVLVRVEQLYPLPSEQIQKLLNGCSAKRYSWVQEEPINQGAWNGIREKLQEVVSSVSGSSQILLEPIARPESSSPAAGMLNLHRKEQEGLMERTFT